MSRVYVGHLLLLWGVYLVVLSGCGCRPLQVVNEAEPADEPLVRAMAMRQPGKPVA